MEELNLQMNLEQNPLGLQAHTFLITHGFIVTVLSTEIMYICTYIH